MVLKPPASYLEALYHVTLRAIQKYAGEIDK